MKYFIDTEFHEYHKQVKCCGIKIDKAIPTIDLISIGIVAEDGREYYAVSKDFNVKDAWNSWQVESKDISLSKLRRKGFTSLSTPPTNIKYWLRDNVLTPIFDELCIFELYNHTHYTFTYSNLKKLINKYGKTNKQIAEEICNFIDARDAGNGKVIMPGGTSIKQVMTTNVEFYGYYADYDWVVICQLFGKMIDLPNGFPMYCRDLKQTLDQLGNPKIPKSDNEHNALADAKWNFELYKFLEKI